MQLTVENCTSININNLQKTIKKTIKKDYMDPSTEETYQYVLKELEKFSVNGQVFKYSSKNSYLGGHRWFFLCPHCDKPSNKLFLPPESCTDRERLYLCKVCHRLKNQSALVGQNNMYKKVTRPIRKMKEIEEKIARGHLKAEKVQELLNEHEKMENELKNCPEYRLYVFKKKHNLMI